MSYHDFAVELVREAGGRINAVRGGVIDILQKGAEPRDEITAADLEINALLVGRIREAYPDHGVISEEGGGADAAGEYRWVIDPIDGTSNFARDIPHFASCVALLEGGVPIAGALYNPVTEELFSFEAGRGAFLNGKTIRCSHVTDPAKAQVLFHIGRAAGLWDWGVAAMRRLLESTKKIKDFGSSGLDLCFLAAARADVVVYGTLTTRDIAGAIGIVRAAGGDVYTLAGAPVELTAEPQTIVAAANRELLQKILPLLRADLLKA